MLLWRALPALASASARVSTSTWLEMAPEVAVTTFRPRVLESDSFTVADPVMSVVTAVVERVLPSSGFSVRARSTVVPVTA